MDDRPLRVNNGQRSPISLGRCVRPEAIALDLINWSEIMGPVHTANCGYSIWSIKWQWQIKLNLRQLLVRHTCFLKEVLPSRIGIQILK